MTTAAIPSLAYALHRFAQACEDAGGAIHAKLVAARSLGFDWKADERLGPGRRGFDPDTAIKPAALRRAGEIWIDRTEAACGVRILHVDTLLPFPADPPMLAVAVPITPLVVSAAARIPDVLYGIHGGRFEVELMGARPRRPDGHHARSEPMRGGVHPAVLGNVLARVPYGTTTGGPNDPPVGPFVTQILTDLCAAVDPWLAANDALFAGALQVRMVINFARPSAHERMAVAAAGHSAQRG